MNMDLWNKFSYMIQLIGACLVFASVVQKREHYICRALVSSAVLLGISYLVNTNYVDNGNFLIALTYWGFFLLSCIVFAFVLIDGTFLEALFCAICGCAIQHLTFDIYLVYTLLGGKYYIVEVVIYVLVYGICYFFVAKPLPSDGRFVVSRKSIIPITTIILIVWVLSCLEMVHPAWTQEENLYRVLYRILDLLCCCYVLWVQINQKERSELQRELDGINYAWRQKKEQYQVTQETIDTINQKCHDLKHQIRALREISDEDERNAYYQDIENAIMIYDTALKTGNKALDAVLMEKGLYCQNHNISLTCMADGLKLDFMKVEDIYAIFGNALDNAIQALVQLSDPQKRVITLKMLTQNSLMMVQIQNYYECELKFVNGLPVTTKRNTRDHGYGMKSILHTAEKYNGTITVRAENNIFTLQILIPC